MRWPYLSILVLAASSCGGEDAGAAQTPGSAGAPGAGGGTAGGACDPAANTTGRIVDIAWPAASNVGHDALEGDTVRFHWTGLHDVVQVATFEGQVAPTGKYGDAAWPGEITSGAKQDGGTFDWNTGTFPCGYRPGIYFFVDEDNPQGGVVSVTLTTHDASHYAPRPCSVLASPNVYGGRYASYADRGGCTVYEVNNFQTEAHFDWVQPVLTAVEGDLVVFRWTGLHNVVQVHDVTKDAPVAGGVNSGAKTNCVGGPAYACASGEGEYAFDTKDWRPGTVHISDECAMTCTGHTTGMNMEIDVRFAGNKTPAPVPGSCCAIDKAKGTACRVVDLYNANDGAQLDYNVPAGRGDLVRFRWAGTLRVYQSTPNADGSPSKTEKPGGVSMPAPIECTPGPSMSCLEGTADTAQFVVDVDKIVSAGGVESDPYGNQWLDFYAKGENTPGFTSADTGTIVYIDKSIPYDAHPAPCP